MSVQKILVDIVIRAYKNDNNKPHTRGPDYVRTASRSSSFLLPSFLPSFFLIPSKRLRRISYSFFAQLYELFSGTAVFCTA